jgi:cysteinyl-tRNA synthetase
MPMPSPAPFRLHNTLTRQVEDFVPQEEGHVGLYVCGMTVYDDCHVGHARAMVTFDTFTRYLRHRGWDVTFVRNFTDVDDKIIQRAKESGEAPLDLANRFIARFHEDMAALGLEEPTHAPRVSTSMPKIIELIEMLVERGHAYAVDGNVWFSVETFDGYGKLSGQKVDEMQRSAETMGGKRAPQDFALWKAAKEGEPAWSSPWGDGRPGWHIECSAMAWELLGVTLDIHGGGLDLVFPHHENEVAQSECGHGTPYVRYWMHNGLLNMEGGRKMGKSLGNVFTIREALELFPAEALRLYYLQVHYRSPLPWNLDALPDALALLARLYEGRDVAEQMKGEEPVERVVGSLGADAKRVVELADGFAARFYGALDDDFNTARALGLAFELTRALNRFANHKKARKRGGPVAAKFLQAMSLLRDGLGLLQLESAAFQAEVKAKRLPTLGLTQEAVEDALTRRVEARQAKDWAEADRLRAELEERGIEVRDGAAGTEWRIRLDAREDADG